MHDDRGSGAALPRRRMLKVLAVAPAALAGCASVKAERATPDASAGASRGPDAAAPEAALAAIRSFPLAPDAEPAFVFRATAARPGEPR
jgi:hypothetical protein